MTMTLSELDGGVWYIEELKLKRLPMTPELEYYASPDDDKVATINQATHSPMIRLPVITMMSCDRSDPHYHITMPQHLYDVFGFIIHDAFRNIEVMELLYKKQVAANAIANGKIHRLERDLKLANDKISDFSQILAGE